MIELIELDAEHPGGALSLLRKRVIPIEYRGVDEKQQVGVASGFHLRDGQLACSVEMDQARHDAVKPMLASGVGKLFVEQYPVKQAIAP